MRDLNGHVDKEAGPHTRAHIGFSFGEFNNEGQFVIDFSLAYNLKIVNNSFRKREDCLITYRRGFHGPRSTSFWQETKIEDCMLTTNKVIPSHGVTIQYRQLVHDIRIKGINPKRRTIFKSKIKRSKF